MCAEYHECAKDISFYYCGNISLIFVVWYARFESRRSSNQHYTANVNRARSGQRITSLGKESDLPSFHITRTRVIITPWQTPRRRLNSSRKNNNNRSKRRSCQRKPSVSFLPSTLSQPVFIHCLAPSSVLPSEKCRSAILCSPKISKSLKMIFTDFSNGQARPSLLV